MLTVVDTNLNVLDKESINLVENVAVHLAALNNGKISPLQLIPYFSLTVSELNNCLDEMVDNHSIIKVIENEITYFQFKNISASTLPDTKLSINNIKRENEILEAAKIEHQIIHAASKIEGRVSAELLSANTDFTLKEVKEILNSLSLGKFISQKLNEDNGSIYYLFPIVHYSDKSYNKIMLFLTPPDPVKSMDAKAVVFFKYMMACILILSLLFIAKVNFRYLVILFIVFIPFSLFMTFLKTKSN